MGIDLKQYPKQTVLAKTGLVFAWLANLSGTDAYYSVYVLCGLIGVLCLCSNVRAGENLSAGLHWKLAGAGLLFSAATVGANYVLFQPLGLVNLFNCLCTLLGGWVVGFEVLYCALRKLPLAQATEKREKAGKLFWTVFLSISAIDLLYLFFAAYPGVLTRDAISTVVQITEGVYDNTMPFWHTVTVGVFYRLGLWLFGDVNGAVACFHVVQIFFMAAVFAYAIVTLYQAGASKWFLLGTYAVYALLPYNIAYSSTLWKDVPFGASALLFVTAFYRILGKVGSNKGNYLCFGLGALGLCLMRTNGFYAFAVTALVLLLLLGRKEKKLQLVMGAILLLCWILLNPVLDALGVSETNMVEALAVPFQQIARVVANDRPLTMEETELLSEAFWLDKVKELYDPGTVDPIKFETFRGKNRAYLEENLGTYVKLYLKLGLKYPGDYLAAWAEETKGYWNAGYPFWIYTKGVDINDLGIAAEESVNLVSKLYAAAFRFLELPEMFQFLYSIGLQVWILVSCFLLNLWKKRKEFLLVIPLLVLAAGLWLGTPVFAEFRYAYPFFTAVPLILGVTLYHSEETQ